MSDKLIISNVENYNKTFEFSETKPYVLRYVELINEYMLYVVENMIIQDFGSVENMKEKFINAGVGQFGSGWCWLVLNKNKLEITKTPNAENPIVHNHIPLLGCDVWEHSYYVDYRNRRPEYLKAFVDNLVNWEKVSEEFSKNL